ncbi:MAG: beta-ketoacyl synthase N-terminal-like domain-containing protein [Cyanobacteria bacterium P01_G01_bin.49]
MSNSVSFEQTGLEIAIIGMVGRFPGAKNLDEFWHNLQNGVESIKLFTDEELEASGIDPETFKNPNYVKARGVLDDVELFDASFFGFNPREAETLDPQQRLFLECAWEALENAGYDSEQYQGLVGVYAGAGMNSYVFNLHSNQNIRNSVDDYQLFISNDKDFLATRASYKLDIEGPSVGIQTACSTSLVAVHLACRSLLSGESDLALAGGVAVNAHSQKSGYLYKEGTILSPDGHCRAFDAQARGTVGGSGLGIVVLKRLEEAIADGDTIHAVIKGSAINNDGGLKVSYTAPSIDTQAKAIKAAQAIAEVDPETISYVEAHGTGTALGDPIEIAALTQAFKAGSQQKNYCAIGSVKTNIGHLDTAAGVTGLIKTVLALKHQQIPPSLHFEQPNPQIDFDNSPFYVNTQLSPWQRNGSPRRAGVSSFGIGGTNAHVILEETPPTQISSASRPWQLLLLSAKTASALETATSNLATHLKQHPDLNLADVAYTLQVGRRGFEHRRMLVCENYEDGVKVLETLDPQRTFTHFQEPCNRQITFMFPGQGSQSVNMGKQLYETELVFKQSIDECCEILNSYFNVDLRSILYPNHEDVALATEQLQQTQITQPVLFAIEYALAKLWMSWDISPVAMIGHSIGEYVAACLAGVFSLEDALTLVLMRGKLMQQMPKGAMLSVPLAEDAIQSYLNEKLSLAAINAPNNCVISGTELAIEELEQALQCSGIDYRRLHTSHAFHSAMMDSILEKFTEEVKKVSLQSPKIPFISNVTGTWITPSQATDPDYWTKHLRHTVRFGSGIAELIKDTERVLLEVGPGTTLNSLAKQQTKDSIILSSISHPKDQQSDVAFLLNTLGRLWLVGVKVNWYSFSAQEQRQRIPLPTYPFERQKYWIKPQKSNNLIAHQIINKKQDIADWFYLSSWKQVNLLEPLKASKTEALKLCYLVFLDSCYVGLEMAQQLEQKGHEVITITIGEKFTQLSDRAYAINPEREDDYGVLWQTLQATGKIPQTIAHFWSVTDHTQTMSNHTLSEEISSAIASFQQYQNVGFYSLLFIAKTLSKQKFTTSLKLIVVTNNLHNTSGEEALIPEKGTVLGACKVIPQEYPNITCRNIDLIISDSNHAQKTQLIKQMVAELTTQSSELVVAYRGRHRWVQNPEPKQLKLAETTRLKKGGVYLIAGDFIGSLGFIFTEYLAHKLEAKLILVGNIGLPQKNQWSQWLRDHGEQNKISQCIKKILTLEESGRELKMIEADPLNFEQMQTAMNQAYQFFDKIHGVFYVTPMSDIKSSFSIQEITRNESELQFHSKVYGLYILEKLLRDKELDFCLLQSSLSSIVGGLGLIAYSAANLFLDSFLVKINRQNSTPWFSINWDAVNYQQKEKKEENALGTTLTNLAMTPDEVWDVCQRVLGVASANQFIVSPGDLQARINTWIKRKSTEKTNDSQKELLSQHSRPNLPTTYLAPGNKIEEIIAKIWQEILGVEQIGVNDNFFELGGHSLLAVQVTSRLKNTFKVELALKTILFDAPTIAGIANVISEKQRNEENEEDAALLEEIKNLSLAEIKQELGESHEQLSLPDSSKN